MQQWKKHIARLVVLLPLLVVESCHNDIQSNVPDCPVCFDMNIRVEYPLFVPPQCQSMFFDKKRYERDAIGYSGLVVWININGEYRAADLCCPHCVIRNKPVQVDGMVAECPTCGEVYELTLYGFPTKGIADQPLKHYGTSYNGEVLRIRN